MYPKPAPARSRHSVRTTAQCRRGKLQFYDFSKIEQKGTSLVWSVAALLAIIQAVFDLRKDMKATAMAGCSPSAGAAARAERVSCLQLYKPSSALGLPSKKALHSFGRN